MKKQPLMLIILDGLGIGKDYEGNAVKRANTSVLDRISREYPTTEIEASGEFVGLPKGQMGNSEVGHLNIGAGRVVYQELSNISNSIDNGDFFKKAELLGAIENARKNGSKIHLMGLVSHGGVHSHMKHLFGLLELMKRENFKDVYVHAILDGRDVSPNAGREDIKELEDKMKELGVGQLASISGRYYAMDRDKRWDRTEKAYNVYLLGQGEEITDPLAAIEKSYSDGVTDEFITPKLVKKDGRPLALVEDGDSLIFFNFRPDRARQITRAFVDRDFEGFTRSKKADLYYVSMTQYDKTIENVEVVFKPEQPRDTLGEIIAGQGLNQLRAAETEKYAHVTFFFNGGREEAFENEDRLLVNSPKVATYDLQPEMSALELKDRIIERLDMDKYDLIILNFANCDMVGHSGIMPATIRAVETVDLALGEILKKLEEVGGSALITADHGNAEKLLDYETGKKVVTAHTTNPVPLIYFGGRGELLAGGRLADLAPTILDILGLDQPELMTGKSLIKK